MPLDRARFEARVDRSGLHHIWLGAKSPGGGGQVRVDGKLLTAARAAWEIENGPVPVGASHVREAVANRDRNRCVGCGTTVNLHFDHLQPHSHGSPSTLENLRLLCAASNLAKGAGSPSDTPRCALRFRP